MKTFMEAMQYRHACKKFASDKHIAEDQFQQILEFGRLSPSSFGMEHWKFVVVESQAMREQLKEACWKQPQISDASHVVVIVAKVADVQPGTDYVAEMFGRRNLPPEVIKAYDKNYPAYFRTEVDPYMNIFAWSSKQCYIALANMMTGAATLGIDSCPIEGFSRSAVDELLGLDTTQQQTAVVVAFGYRAGEQTARFRQPLERLVETI